MQFFGFCGSKHLIIYSRIFCKALTPFLGANWRLQFRKNISGFRDGNEFKGATLAKPKAITKEIHSTTFNVLVDISFLENNFSTTELLLLLQHNINFHVLLQTEVHEICKMLHPRNVSKYSTTFLI